MFTVNFYFTCMTRLGLTGLPCLYFLTLYILSVVHHNTKVNSLYVKTY